MAMSTLYNKIAQKPIKRNQEQINMPFSQSHPWVNVETINNNASLLLSPPHHNNNSLMQRENMQVTQPCSGPASPLASPGALNVTSSFGLSNNITNSSTAGNSNGFSGINISNGNGNSSTSAIDTDDPNWQATKFTIRERNAAMFNNELMSDIRFEVGSEDNIQIIPAHKYVLATGSSVFYAMFFGGLAENNEEIRVPDVEPSAFLTLLKYLYCDEIQLEADTVLATLYVAKKYIVPHLARACVNYLETSLTAKNACLLLSQSRLFEEPELMQRCWEVIDAQVCYNNSSINNNNRQALDSLNLVGIDDIVIVRNNFTVTTSSTSIFTTTLTLSSQSSTSSLLSLTPSSSSDSLLSSISNSLNFNNC